jgi:hypothetical protein
VRVCVPRVVIVDRRAAAWARERCECVCVRVCACVCVCVCVRESDRQARRLAHRVLCRWRERERLERESQMGDREGQACRLAHRILGQGERDGRGCVRVCASCVSWRTGATWACASNVCVCACVCACVRVLRRLSSFADRCPTCSCWPLSLVPSPTRVTSSGGASRPYASITRRGCIIQLHERVCTSVCARTWGVCVHERGERVCVCVCVHECVCTSVVVG